MTDPVIAARLATLSRRYARLNNWQWAWHNHHHNDAPAPSLRQMPSKALKAWAYDDLAAIVAATGLTVPADHARSLRGMHWVLTTLGKRPRPVAPPISAPREASCPR